MRKRQPGRMGGKKLPGERAVHAGLGLPVGGPERRLHCLDIERQREEGRRLERWAGVRRPGSC